MVNDFRYTVCVYPGKTLLKKLLKLSALSPSSLITLPPTVLTLPTHALVVSLVLTFCRINLDFSWPAWQSLSYFWQLFWLHFLLRFLPSCIPSNQSLQNAFERYKQTKFGLLKALKSWFLPGRTSRSSHLIRSTVRRRLRAVMWDEPPGWCVTLFSWSVSVRRELCAHRGRCCVIATVKRDCMNQGIWITTIYIPW